MRVMLLAGACLLLAGCQTTDTWIGERPKATLEQDAAVCRVWAEPDGAPYGGYIMDAAIARRKSFDDCMTSAGWRKAVLHY